MSRIVGSKVWDVTRYNAQIMSRHTSYEEARLEAKRLNEEHQQR